MKKFKNAISSQLNNVYFKFWLGFFINQLYAIKQKPAISPNISLLIPAPGGGNIGDQAMLESFLFNISGKKIIIKTNTNKLDIPDKYAVGVEVIDMTGLIYGSFFGFLKDFLRLQQLMPSTKAFFIIGADIMDGGYNKDASAMRSYLAYYFATRKIPVRIFGFSWNASPAAIALSAIKKAAAKGVLLCVRDPISYRRLEKTGIKNILQVADMVFANEHTQDDGIEDALGFCQGKKIAIVNASGLISKGINQVDEYRQVIDKLTIKGFSVVLLPHVIRPGADDFPICNSLSVEFPSAFFVNTLLEPNQVRRLVEEAKLVVTGRMHLSIICMSKGVPAIVLSTQGKVDGLMELFNLKGLSIEPITGFGAQVCDQIDKICDQRDMYISNISHNLPSIKQLAYKNFS